MNAVHGMSRHGNRHPIYIAWQNLRKRCTCKEGHANYKHYSGRGITYDPHWEVFENFFEDMGPTWAEGLTIDRIDNDGNYCKENCRWATLSEQAQNKSTTWKIRYEGEYRSLKELEAITGLPDTTIRKRINEGWDIDRVFNTPYQKEPEQLYSHDGITRTIKEWADHFGVTASAVRSHLFTGKSMEQIIAYYNSPASSIKVNKRSGKRELPKVGQVYGNFTILSIPSDYKDSHSNIEVRCACGRISMKAFNKIKNGHIQRCTFCRTTP